MMVKKLVLGLVVCSTGIFDEVTSMESHVVVNPINEIVGQRIDITPEGMVESFKSSANRLLEEIESKLKEIEPKEERCKDNKLLYGKWKAGSEILRSVIDEADRSSRYRLGDLFTKVCDITDNGFYDVSNTIITIDPSKKGLRTLFCDFWHHLLQAREIVAWWVCSASKIDIKDIPYLCFEACGLVKNQDINNILWSISILGNVSQAIQELNESGEPLDFEILKAKENAKMILTNALNSAPNLRSSLEHFVKDE